MRASAEVCCLAGVLLGLQSLSPTPVTADAPRRVSAPSPVTESAPPGPADVGEKDNLCTAPALASAQRRDGSIEVVTRPAMTRFEISPATMEPATVEVTTRATVTRLEAIEPTWAERTRSVEISPGQVRWVRDALTGELPLSAGERADIEASGIALEEVEPGRCVREFHVPPVVAERRHQVLLQEPAQIYRVTDAKLRKETQTVTLVPEHRRLIEVPPVIREQRSRLRVNFDSSALPSTDTSSPVAYQSVDHLL